MQIIINISDSIYKDLQLGIGVGVVLKPEDIVVLPKGHGRLIDADELKQVYECTEDAQACKWTLYGVTSEIDDAPTIVEAERK